MSPDVFRWPHMKVLHVRWNEKKLYLSGLHPKTYFWWRQTEIISLRSSHGQDGTELPPCTVETFIVIWISWGVVPQFCCTAESGGCLRMASQVKVLNVRWNEKKLYLRGLHSKKYFWRRQTDLILELTPQDPSNWTERWGNEWLSAANSPWNSVPQFATVYISLSVCLIDRHIIYIYIYIYLYLFKCIYLFMYIYIYIFKYTYSYIYVYLYLQLSLSVFIYREREREKTYKNV